MCEMTFHDINAKDYDEAVMVNVVIYFISIIVCLIIYVLVIIEEW